MTVDGKRIAECVDCHDHHRVSDGIGLGSGGNGAAIEQSDAPLVGKRISRERFVQSRNEMIEKCNRCHTSPRILKELSLADSIKADADASLSEIIESIKLADEKGILDKLKVQHGESANEAFFVSVKELNTNASYLETLLYKACKVAHPMMWKAAYHQSPGNIRKGRRLLDRVSHEIRNELRRLRTQKTDH